MAIALLSSSAPAFCQVFQEGSAWRHWAAYAGVSAEQLYSIALKESGLGGADGKLRPYPWTINSPQGSRRFATKKEAYAEIRRLIGSGVYNIDLGMMQVNLYHHWARVNGKDILEPAINLAVGAQILREAMASAGGDIDRAIGIYHAGAAGSSERMAGYRAGVKRYEIAIAGH